MSGAVLYLAIIAIWAFVLVPRWVHRSHSQAGSEHFSGYPAGEHGEDEDEEFDDGYAAEPEHQGYPPPLPTSRMLQARRRLLTMLVLLTAAAAGCTYIKLTPWWVCAPPAGLLFTYLLLLREAARADAEQAHRRADAQARYRAARRREYEASLPQHVHLQWPVEQAAEVIDISGRVRDQLYDQYADASERAVGD